MKAATDLGKSTALQIEMLPAIDEFFCNRLAV
jgi:hypothetical protein